jgi:hypothetical protein
MADLQVAVASLLDQADDLLQEVPHIVWLIGNCVFAATFADDVRDNYMLHYWVRRLLSKIQ